MEPSFGSWAVNFHLNLCFLVARSSTRSHENDGFKTYRRHSVLEGMETRVGLLRMDRQVDDVLEFCYSMYDYLVSNCFDQETNVRNLCFSEFWQASIK